VDDTEILHAARGTVEQLGDQLADLLAHRPGVAEPVSPAWTVRDAAAHLIGITGLYSELAAGAASPIPLLTPAAVTEYNAARLADITESDPRALAKALAAAVCGFLDATGNRPAATVIHWHGEIRLDVARLAGILVAEFVLHGFDITAAVGVPWPIASEHAALALFGRGAVLDRVVDPVAGRGHTATYVIDLGAAGRLGVRFADGALTVGEPDEAPDCVIILNPVTMLLVTSGRLSPWTAVALGLLRGGGRQPDLAPGFSGLLHIF
jgi:uncharacterized protein (TIGR03083 family)